VARAVQARRPQRTGGTQAPRAYSRGPRAGVGQARPANGYRAGIGPSRPAQVQPGPSTLGAGVAAPNGPTPTPWNSKAEQIVAGARRNYLAAQGNFDLAEREAQQDYGLDPGFNDYKANPNSRAALLEQSYQNANRGTVNSAGLQLYSGATSNALGANRGVYGRSRDELAKSYREALGEIGQGRVKAAQEQAEREQEAEWDRIAAAEAAEPDASAAPPGKAKPKNKPKGGGGKGPGVGGARPASKPRGKR
jgi:hypothetical protein